MKSRRFERFTVLIVLTYVEPARVTVLGVNQEGRGPPPRRSNLLPTILPPRGSSELKQRLAPWGVINAYFNDFFAQDRGLTVQVCPALRPHPTATPKMILKPRWRRGQHRLPPPKRRKNMQKWRCRKYDKKGVHLSKKA